MTVNKRAIADSFSRAAIHYDGVAQVQRHIGDAMLSLLAQQKKQYESTLDIGCGTGSLTLALAPFTGTLTALDLAPGMLAVAQQRDQQQVINQFICGDAESLPFSEHSFDFIFSSFALQWCDDLAQVFNDIFRLLKPRGRFLFSIPVENTLIELKQSWQQAEANHNHVNQFHSVDWLGAALQRSGFKVIEFSEHTEQVFYDSVRELTLELKTLGAHQVTSNRTETLTGKQTLMRMLKAYECFRTAQGKLPASWHYVIACLEK